MVYARYGMGMEMGRVHSFELGVARRGSRRSSREIVRNRRWQIRISVGRLLRVPCLVERVKRITET